MLSGWACTVPSEPPAKLYPYSVQLHVHGSYSEGIGSINSHSHEAAKVGVDLIWWSDHDWRISSYRNASSFAFESWEEPLDHRESWKAQIPKETRGRKWWRATDRGSDGVLFTQDLTSDNAAQGERSLRIQGSSQSKDFVRHALTFASTRDRGKRPLASLVTLRLALYPENLGANARGFVEVELSEHPCGADEALQTLLLRYTLGERGEDPHRVGCMYEVPLAYQDKEWNRLELRVTHDVRAGFPEIHGEDNSLAEISIGVESREGAFVSLLVDDFSIDQVHTGTRAFLEQARLIDDVAKDYPGLKQVQGVEISYLKPHLNVFAEASPLPDYDQLLEQASVSGRITDEEHYDRVQEEIAIRIVELAHRSGALVSVNHFFGTQDPGYERYPAPEDLLRRRKLKAKALLSNHAYGADLLEVGYRERGGHDLADHLWLWDKLALGGLHMIGTGVSDSHGGEHDRWATSPNNFVSWVYADSLDKEHLIKGLRAGRVFFGDIVQFDGRIDLRTAQGFSMGQIVLTDSGKADVSFEAHGLVAGDIVRIVVSGVQQTNHRVEGSAFVHTAEVPLDPEKPTVVRFEVYDEHGTEKVFSNPITFVRRLDREIADLRAGISVAGFVSRSIRGVVLRGVAVEQRGDEAVVVLTGTADQGHVELDCGGSGVPSTVEFVGMSGRWSFDSGVLNLHDLNGDGRVEIRRH